MDHQGSVTKVTDANQKIQIAYVNDAFGRQIIAPAGANPMVPNDLVFQSNWITANIGTKQYGISPSRIYDFETGRFLSRDPLPGIINLLSSAISQDFPGIYNNTIFETALPSILRDKAIIKLVGDILASGNLYVSPMSTEYSDPTGMDVGAEMGRFFGFRILAEIAEKAIEKCLEIENKAGCEACCNAEEIAGLIAVHAPVVEDILGCRKLIHPIAIGICLAAVALEYGLAVRKIIRVFDVTKPKCKDPPGSDPQPKTYPPDNPSSPSTPKPPDPPAKPTCNRKPNPPPQPTPPPFVPGTKASGKPKTPGGPAM
jgi:hypothetical protein